MANRPRRRLLAIPPESHSEQMAVFVRKGQGLVVEGEMDGEPDWFCGRCGRLLAVKVPQGQIRGIWLTCTKCSWLNGFDVDLTWARYVVEQLEERKLTLARLHELLDDLKEGPGADEFLARNADVAQGPIGWLAKISVPTLVAILTLLYFIYSGERTHETTREQLKVQKEQLEVQRDAQKSKTLTPEDIREIAQRLHELQEGVRLKPPPKPPGKARP